MTIGRDTLSKAKTVTVAAVEAGVPTLVEAREIIAEFHMMIRRKTAADLTSWIERARISLVASFGSGVLKDEAAVRAAITLPWSNGQTEGQITRLKLVRLEDFVVFRNDGSVMLAEEILDRFARIQNPTAEQKAEATVAAVAVARAGGHTPGPLSPAAAAIVAADRKRRGLGDE
jgi:hypothetical protein